MLIEQIAVKNFRNLADVNLTLQPGITLIKAKNEGGKTSLRKAVEIALFGDPRSAAAKVYQHQTWGQNSLYEIRLDFSADGKRYRLVRDFEARTSVLENLADGKKLTDKKRIEEKLAEILGLPTATLFLNTVYFSAEEMIQLKNAEELRKRLEEKLSGLDGVVVSKLLKDIDDHLSELTKGLKGTAKNPGPIRRLTDKLDALQAELREMEETVRQAAAKYAEYYETSQAIATLKEQLAIKETENEKYVQYKKAKEMWDNATARLNTLTDQLAQRANYETVAKQLADELTQIETQGQQIAAVVAAIDQALQTAAELARSRTDAQILATVLAKIAAAQADLEAAQTVLAGCVAVKPADVKTAQKLASEIHGLAQAGKNEGFVVDITPLTAALPTVIVDGEPLTNPAQTVEARASVEIELPGVARIRIGNKNADAAKRLAAERQARANLAALLAGYGASDPDELARLKEAYDQASAQVQAKQAALTALLGGHPLEHYHQQQAAWARTIEGQEQALQTQIQAALAAASSTGTTAPAASDLPAALAWLQTLHAALTDQRDKLRIQWRDKNNELQQVQGRLKQLPPADKLEADQKAAARDVFVAKVAFDDLNLPAISPEQLIRLEKEVADLKHELRDKEIAQAKLEAYLATVRYGIEDIETKREEIETCQEQLRALQEEVQVLSILKEWFSEARNNTVAKITSDIGDALLRYFNTLTEGRYNQVGLSPDLSPMVFSADKGDHVDIGSELSTGTRDQLYFATRLALIPAISQGKKPPLLLDDPFVHFDPDRRAKAFALLKELAKDHQILLFTCGDGCDAYADTVINL
ncbi:ATPase involved in DNA repair-like [Thermosinus carboxydivorans Nor1]|uniref:ATPase involved in DNA repair-like n=1 Tax=Thermosinus carboxydivorans Nor1 TaxID=401526 RepID=A1HMM5_9FIRM|nr:SMC family ATPase [Thermosinus carboxydivorans]EAX48515.1 ATPase involved in DNA repair-like [Thermosinus carboxydivorans Nor1]